MQGLEIEEHETSHQGMTIFSRVLAPPVDEPRRVEDFPHPNSPPPEDKTIWCASPPQGLKQHEGYMLVVTSSMGRLDLAAGGNHPRISQGGRDLFWNPQMLAMFPPPREVSHYGGTTLTKLNE